MRDFPGGADFPLAVLAFPVCRRVREITPVP